MAENKRRPNIERFIAKSTFEIERARQLGLERLLSVNGPYLVNAATGRVVATYRSAAYVNTLYGSDNK